MNERAKWTKLTELLVKRTNEGSLTWKPTATDFEFQTVINDFVVEIERYDGEVFVRVRNDSGKVIDSFKDSDLEQDPFEDTWNSILWEFVRGLDRQASGADEALENIIGHLDK
ncbi:MAG: hypothetical protein AB3N17_07730 [Tateyamaria sp.]